MFDGIFVKADRLIVQAILSGRKVRTPKCSIVANGHRYASGVVGKVQQKVCTGNAVVKSGKLYVVQCHVSQRLRVARPMLVGRQLEPIGNDRSR